MSARSQTGSSGHGHKALSKVRRFVGWMGRSAGNSRDCFRLFQTVPEKEAVRPEVTPAPTGFRSWPVVSSRVGWTRAAAVWRPSCTRVFLDLGHGERSSAATASVAVKGTVERIVLRRWRTEATNLED